MRSGLGCLFRNGVFGQGALADADWRKRWCWAASWSARRALADEVADDGASLECEPGCDDDGEHGVSFFTNLEEYQFVLVSLLDCVAREALNERTD